MAFKLREVNSPLKCWKGYKRKAGTKKFSKGRNIMTAGDK